MTSQSVSNLPASVRQRLYNLAHNRNDDFQRILMQYALERLLYRLSRSRHANRFILKGALLFLIWMEEPHRRTRDLDLLGSGEPSPDHLTALFQEICLLVVEPDGLSFDKASVSAKSIREDDIYGGIRINLIGYLDKARISIQVDVGFGDVVIPLPTFSEFPGLLDFPTPYILTYERETVIAEKLSAIITLDMDNSRMKDFFDIWILGQKFTFDGRRLSAAIQATFQRRKLDIPVKIPTGLSSEFSDNPAKQTQWRAFIRHSLSTDQQTLTLREVVRFLEGFLYPVLKAVSVENDFPMNWLPGGPWKI